MNSKTKFTLNQSTLAENETESKGEFGNQHRPTQTAQHCRSQFHALGFPSIIHIMRLLIKNFQSVEKSTPTL